MSLAGISPQTLELLLGPGASLVFSEVGRRELELRRNEGAPLEIIGGGNSGTWECWLARRKGAEP